METNKEKSVYIDLDYTRVNIVLTEDKKLDFWVDGGDGVSQVSDKQAFEIYKILKEKFGP